MNKKSTDIKLIVFLTIIFFTMFMVFYFTININNTTLVQKVESIRAINETTTNSKTNTTSSSSKNSSTNSSTNTTTKSSNTSKINAEKNPLIIMGLTMIAFGLVGGIIYTIRK